MKNYHCYITIFVLTFAIYPETYSQSILDLFNNGAGSSIVNTIINSVVSNHKSKNDTLKYSNAQNSNSTAWTCEECGHINSSGTFCQECGHKKNVETVENENTEWDCPNCGAKGNIGKFCSNCGTKKTEPWTCPDCGKAGNTGVRCPDCGAKRPIISSAADTIGTAYVNSLLPIVQWTSKTNLFTDNKTTLNFITYQHALDALSSLELPTAKEMIFPENITAWSNKQRDIEIAASNLAIKYSNMALTLKSKNLNISEEKNIQYKEIKDILDKISDDNTVSRTSITEDLRVLAENIQSSWISSEEKETVRQMINQKKSKEEINAVIASWNFKQAIKWRKKIVEHLEDERHLSEELAKVDSELENIATKHETDVIYVQLKKLCCSKSPIIVNYVTIPSLLRNVPLANYIY